MVELGLGEVCVCWCWCVVIDDGWFDSCDGFVVIVIGFEGFWVVLVVEIVDEVGDEYDEWKWYIECEDCDEGCCGNVV